MPLIRSTTRTEDQSQEADLVRELARELTSEATPDHPLHQPIVFEREMAPANVLHVTVVWEKWRLVPAGSRSQVILAAYEHAHPDKADQIAIAMGITTEEAIDLGLLSYAIELNARNNELSSEQLEHGRKLMRDEGAVETPTGLQLRFPNLELANRAYDRLIEKTGWKFWSLVETRRQAERE